MLFAFSWRATFLCFMDPEVRYMNPGKPAACTWLGTVDEKSPPKRGGMRGNAETHTVWPADQSSKTIVSFWAPTGQCAMIVLSYIKHSQNSIIVAVAAPFRRRTSSTVLMLAIHVGVTCMPLIFFLLAEKKSITRRRPLRRSVAVL